MCQPVAQLALMRTEHLQAARQQGRHRNARRMHHRRRRSRQAAPSTNMTSRSGGALGLGRWENEIGGDRKARLMEVRSISCSFSPRHIEPISSQAAAGEELSIISRRPWADSGASGRPQLSIIDCCCCARQPVDYST